MTPVQRDYILRMIEMVAAAIARVLRRRQEGDFAGARQEIAAAIGEVLGPRGAIAAMADSRTAADLISDPRQIAMYSRLLAEDADVLEEMGDPANGRSVRQRALELLLETIIRKMEVRDEDRAQLRLLASRVDRTSLASRYADALRAENQSAPIE